jgi:probable phosphomutase (TIGR03848 family)
MMIWILNILKARGSGVMAVFLLIRHGITDAVGRILAGRMPGVHLNVEGRAQAEQLGQRLSDVPVDFLYSSPLERAKETAAPIASAAGLKVQVCEEITEIDFGEWSGKRIDDLLDLPTWRQFNTFRSGTRIPGGESMSEVQVRMVSQIEKMRRESPDALIALVSHADPIKAAIAYYAGISLDLLLRIEVGPASVSALSINDYGPQILCVNDCGGSPPYHRPW